MKLVQFAGSNFGNVWVNPDHIVFVSTQHDNEKAILWMAVQNGTGANGGGAPFQLYLEDAYHVVLAELGNYSR